MPTMTTTAAAPLAIILCPHCGALGDPATRRLYPRCYHTPEIRSAYPTSEVRLPDPPPAPVSPYMDDPDEAPPASPAPIGPDPEPQSPPPPARKPRRRRPRRPG